MNWQARFHVRLFAFALATREAHFAPSHQRSGVPSLDHRSLGEFVRAPVAAVLLLRSVRGRVRVDCAAVRLQREPQMRAQRSKALQHEFAAGATRRVTLLLRCFSNRRMQQRVQTRRAAQN